MNTKKLLALILTGIMLLSLSLPMAVAEETIKIGGISVLTGPASLYGIAVQKGVDLYMEQLNAQGGIDGKKVEMLWMDDQGDPTSAQAAYYKLVENDGVVAIIGAVLTGATKAVAEAAEADGIPMISASATAYEITTGRPNVFRTCFLDPFQAVMIARYVKDEGVTKAAVLYDNGDEYSTGLYNAFKEECEKLGITVTSAESAATADVDFKAQLTNIKATEPEVVFLPYYGAPAAYILKQAKEIGLDVKFYGADGISNVIDSITDTSLLPGITYTDHFTDDADSEIAKNYMKSFEEKYGEKPTLAFSATAYDAALVMTEAIKTAGSTDFAAVVEAIKNSNVEGVTGNITFDGHNDPIKSVFFTTFDADGNRVFIKRMDP